MNGLGDRLYATMGIRLYHVKHFFLASIYTLIGSIQWMFCHGANCQQTEMNHKSIYHHQSCLVYHPWWEGLADKTAIAIFSPCSSYD
jgi:hypothetical protein